MSRRRKGGMIFSAFRARGASHAREPHGKSLPSVHRLPVSRTFYHPVLCRSSVNRLEIVVLVECDEIVGDRFLDI